MCGYDRAAVRAEAVVRRNRSDRCVSAAMAWREGGCRCKRSVLRCGGETRTGCVRAASNRGRRPRRTSPERFSVNPPPRAPLPRRSLAMPVGGCFSYSSASKFGPKSETCRKTGRKSAEPAEKTTTAQSAPFMHFSSLRRARSRLTATMHTRRRGHRARATHLASRVDACKHANLPRRRPSC